MTRITTWLAIGFFVIAFGLAYTAKERSEQANRLGIPQATAPASEAQGDMGAAAPSTADLPVEAEQNEDIPEL